MINAAKDPQAGIDPSAEGPVGSGLVAMNRAPPSMSLMARVMFSKEWVRVYIPDHVYSAASLLVGQKLGRVQRGGPDAFLRDVDATAQQPRPKITSRVDRIVGQHQEAASMLLQGGNELRCARQRLLLVHQYAIHVSQPRFDGLRISHGSHSCARLPQPTQLGTHLLPNFRV